MKLVQVSKRFVKRNSATILTCVGAVGVAATTVMAIKATPKAVTLLDEAKKEKGEALTKFEVVKVAGPVYIPTVVTGVATLACIFGANVLNKRQQASLVSAYALLDKSYKAHKDKIEDLYGEGANAKVREEIAKDVYKEEAITVNDDEILFYDDFSGRYFNSTIEAVQQAEYNINRDLNQFEVVSVNDFYKMLGLEPMHGGDMVGWSTDGNHMAYWTTWIDFTHETVTLEDGLECKIISMSEPYIGYDD